MCQAGLSLYARNCVQDNSDFAIRTQLRARYQTWRAWEKLTNYDVTFWLKRLFSNRQKETTFDFTQKILTLAHLRAVKFHMHATPDFAIRTQLRVCWHWSRTTTPFCRKRHRLYFRFADRVIVWYTRRTNAARQKKTWHVLESGSRSCLFPFAEYSPLDRLHALYTTSTTTTTPPFLKWGIYILQACSSNELSVLFNTDYIKVLSSPSSSPFLFAFKFYIWKYLSIFAVPMWLFLENEEK